MSRPILVTGATGKNGSEVVRQLMARGETVRAAARDTARAAALFGPAVEVVAFDYTRSETFDAALAGAERVFVLPPTGGTADDRLVNPFVDHAAAAGTGRLVFMSAIDAERGDNPLGRVEQHVRATGLAYTFLRPNWFMQNFSHGFILPMIRDRGEIVVAAGDAKISFVDVRDIAAVAAAVLAGEGYAGQTVVVTGGRALGFAEAAAVISAAAGREIRYLPVSEDAMRDRLVASGWQFEEAAMFAGLFRAVRDGWTAPVSPAVERILGRAPLSFERFAEENAAVWKER